MPKCDETTLRDHIAHGRIGAVSLDTSIFEQYQNNFSSSSLLGLQQFHGTPTRFVLSETVAGEVKAHVAKEAEAAKAKLRMALKGVRKAWLGVPKDDEVHRVLGLEATPLEFAEDAFNEFTKQVGLEIIMADGLVTHAEVLERYFKSHAPFADKENKKNEFPDALALLSLQAWAAENETLVLLVSRDGDWQAFAEMSDRLFCISDLTNALEFFNRGSELAVERAIKLLMVGEAPHFHSEVESALERFLETFEPDVTAWSSMEYEIDYIECALQHWEVDDETYPKVIKADEEGILFAMTIKATVDFSVTFNLSVRDGIDRDYIDMGSTTPSTEKNINVPVTVWIDSKTDGEPNVLEVEVIPPKVTVHFHGVDSHWAEEED